MQMLILETINQKLMIILHREKVYYEILDEKSKLLLFPLLWIA